MMIPEIPNGLGANLLNKKYGKKRKQIADLLLKRASVKTFIDQSQSERMKNYLIKEREKIDQDIRAFSDYLETWYFAYYNLCSKCVECVFNNEDRYCSFYGKNKIPEPNLNKPNKVCGKFIKIEKDSSVFLIKY